MAYFNSPVGSSRCLAATAGRLWAKAVAVGHRWAEAAAGGRFRAILLAGGRLWVIAVAAMSVGCSRASIRTSYFGTLSSGERATLFTLTNTSGASVSFTDYGLRIVSIMVPDLNGSLGDVVVGYGKLDDFETKDRFVGCVLGRYANRLDSASVVLDGQRYQLEANECREGVPVQCHGGSMGFDRFIWESEPCGATAVRFHRISPSLEEGYPGNLDCHVTYTWTEDNVLRIEYEACTDAVTVVNLSNHTYFNPRGAESCDYVMSCRLWVDADSCILNNGRYIPESIVPVEGTALDFRVERRMDQKAEMPLGSKIPVGSWLVRDWDGTLRKVASLYDSRCGRLIEDWTTEPNMLTFAARSWTGSVCGKYGPLEKYSGMLFENLHPADSPNQPRFPSTLLRPGEKYYSCTEYRFLVR